MKGMNLKEELNCYIFEFEHLHYMYDYYNGIIIQLTDKTYSELKQIINNESVCIEQYPYVQQLINCGMIYGKRNELINNKESSTAYLSFAPIYQCNFRCSYCFGEYGYKYKGKIRQYNDETIIDMLNYFFFTAYPNYQQYRIDFVSGGEPLIYNNIVQLIKLITQNGMKASLNTNGWFLTQDMFKKLIDAGLLIVNLSIDYPTTEKHDELRGLPGLFKKATEQIKRCKETGIPFKLNVRMVLSKHNYKEISEMIKLARELNADMLSIDMIEADSKNKLFLLNKDEIIDFKENYVPMIVEQVKNLNIKENLKEFNIQQLKDMFNTNFNPIQNFENGLYWPDEHIKKKCDIPSSFMIIEGDGMVLPCNAVEYNRDKIIGNILDTDIIKLWNSNEWNEFRKNKMDFCRECPMNMCYMLVFNDEEINRDYFE